MRHPCPQTFALRLLPMPENELAGEIEHVLSGERLRFANAHELLAALRTLQRPPPVVPPRAG
ncbi:MAG: hypothetical protein H6933_07360 [Burkholderiaceae bacterium]|nr:hypothetical protein [Rhodoferax sp.]MCP5284698.1 hypothetical protein [Burkholderiaceae bacterium]